MKHTHNGSQDFRNFLKEFTAGSSMHIYDEPVLLESVEKCPRCKKLFKTKWGEIFGCSGHKDLEPAYLLA